MMNIYELIKTRRTIHAYKPESVDTGLIEKIVEAGHYAPAHKLTWPWRFTLVGPKTRQEIADIAVAIKSQNRELTAEMQEAITNKITNPAALVVVSQVRHEEPFRSKEDYAAVSCAIQNIHLAAHSEGLGAKWSTGGVTRDPRTYKAVNIDEGIEEIVGFVWIGVPAATPTIKRPEFESVVRKLA